MRLCVACVRGVFVCVRVFVVRRFPFLCVVFLVFVLVLFNCSLIIVLPLGLIGLRVGLKIKSKIGMLMVLLFFRARTIEACRPTIGLSLWLGP